MNIKLKESCLDQRVERNAEEKDKEDCCQVNISSCEIADNQETGVIVANSAGVILTGNTITRNKQAVYWDSVSEVKGVGNKIFNNAEPGMEPGDSSPASKSKTGSKNSGIPHQARYDA